MRISWLLAAGLAATSVARADDLSTPDPTPPCALTTRIAGTVRDAKSAELIAGATIIIASELAPAGGAMLTAITDETGTFAQDVAPGTYTVSVYYADTTWEQKHVLVASGRQVQLLVPIDSRGQPVGCDFGPPDVAVIAMPHFGLSLERGDFLPVARDRTDRAWIAPVASADPARAVANITGAPRLTGGLGVPVAFLTNVVTRTLRTSIEDPSGSGGAVGIDTYGGSNEVHGDVRAIAMLPGGAEGDALLGGPIVHDHAWWAAGLVATEADPAHGSPVSTDAYAKIDVAPDPDNRISATGLAQAHADGARDDWADAMWNPKFAENRLSVVVGATAESLALPATAIARALDPVAPERETFAGGRAGVTYYLRAIGSHRLAAGIAGGEGTADGVRHATATAYAGDEWYLAPDWKVEAGVRGELRDFGDARAQVLVPRLAVDWDPTTEGRASVFVAYQRVPHLDDGAIGAWVTSGAPRFHDEVAGGVAYEPASQDWIVAGVAARLRWQDAAMGGGDDVRAGLEAWTRLRVGSRLSLHASATSLDRAAATMAMYKLGSNADGVSLLASARAGAAAPLLPTSERREAGVGIAWRHRVTMSDDDKGEARPAFTSALELLDGDLGPAARLSITAGF